MPLTVAAAAGPYNRGENIAWEIIASVDSRLDGKSFETAGKLFDNYLDVNGVWSGTRNASVWCADIAGITCICPWNVGGWNIYTATPIAPDVVIWSTHAVFSPGQVLHWRTAGGTLVARTIDSVIDVAGTDLSIGKLSSVLPDTIGFAKVFSASVYASLIATINAGAVKIPAFGTDQEEKAIVRDCATQGAYATFQVPVNAKRLEFYEELAGGDSSSPIFWIYNGQLAIITAWHTGETGSGSSIHGNRAAINAGMTTLGSAYQLTEITI